MRAKGFLTISSITDADGKMVPLQKAVDYGWVKGLPKTPAGWGIGRDEIPMGQNLFVDTGRQLTAYAMGGVTPTNNNIITNFGVGTGTNVPSTLDVQLGAPLVFNSGLLLKPVDYIDYPVPFVARASITLGVSDCNGYLITEWGLFSTNSTMIARWVRSAGLSKTSDFSPTYLWRIRF